MPSEPRLIALRDDLVTTLHGMSRHAGYRYDYRGVQVGTGADWETEKDYKVPMIHVLWQGAIEGDPKHGGEAVAGGAPNRFRRWDQFMVSAAVKDKTDPFRVAMRIHADWHAALLGQSNRVRSGSRVRTCDAGPEWFPIYEADQPMGGILAVTFTIQWDHVTGDMASQ